MSSTNDLIREQVYESVRARLDTRVTDHDCKELSDSIAHWCISQAGDPVAIWLDLSHQLLSVRGSYSGGRVESFADRPATTPEQAVKRMLNSEPIRNPGDLMTWLMDRRPKTFSSDQAHAIHLEIVRLGSRAGCKIGESWAVVLEPLDAIMLTLLEVPELAL